MKKNALKGLAFVALVALTACFGQHNQAPSKGLNLESERIYGVRGEEPRQLPLRDSYPSDEKSVNSAKNRVDSIRTALYPR